MEDNLDSNFIKHELVQNPAIRRLLCASETSRVLQAQTEGSVIFIPIASSLEFSPSIGYEFFRMHTGITDLSGSQRKRRVFSLMGGASATILGDYLILEDRF